jgi:hypothetical protein
MRGASSITGKYVALATPQHAVLGLEQLTAMGLTEAAVRKRAAAAHLHRVHVGVYSLVPPSMLSLKGHFLAAVFACGQTAALSHRSAAHLLGLRATSRERIDVIVPGKTKHARPGIDCHCSVNLTADDITIVDHIPVTTVARTALDLAAVVPRRQVERALDQAEILEVYDHLALLDQLDRNPRHPGAPTLKAILADHLAGTTETWSELEELCLAATRAAGVPPPEVNAFVDPGDGEPPIRADFVWRAQRVVVEADGFATHKTHGAFETDRRRDQRLHVAGWRPLRVTWRQLTNERARIERTLIILLTRE